MVKDSSVASLVLIRLRRSRLQEGEKRRTGAADGGGSQCRKECGSSGGKVKGSKEVSPCQRTGPADHAMHCMPREAEIHGQSPRSSSERGWKTGEEGFCLEENWE